MTREHIISGLSVDPETVGQYTGLDDKNGVKIFEGDIVKWEDSDGNVRVNAVKYDLGGFYICNSCYPVGHYSALLVIGNIHDNPELLKGAGA